MTDAKKLANELMVAHGKLTAAARLTWSHVHGLSEWNCGDCGHGGLGEELDCDGDGSPLCPWCSSDKVRPRIHGEDLEDTAEGREAIVPVGSNADQTFFVSEFSAWLESMQADGYASDDIANTVKAECETLLKSR
jgi:hypothetical protein